MPLPEPECGLVISYAYLWRNEYAAGKIEGQKNRPCAIILAIKNTNDKQTVTVAPITHTPPRDPAVAIEIPPRVKQHLALDGEQSWLILDDFNEFLWPGYDLRPISGTMGKYDYGLLPPALFNQITDKILELRQKGIRPTPRD
ncbi:MAG: type II toxin-antitoxin system PemK/MazF family toxin [Methylovulum sp.]|uniref:type II toxin-antitoxin system PemK/MazF family toxin n=1 Tax=Methylovulum sp. TaxID=1916980 RepID=UPI0026250383|nr:type II toxin-antitoxin system PemK/MazF family toxin [Methylovulum sp.]MDD2724291.1 type II toxin-antitoxin system PemK/MazF family toxin [Methylovulum sp.]MDD5122976.1 type II toxin-antitoxin system PemK/MazF family toxin [Methylovulum sp.]